jgi:hypothetical protein
VVTWNPVYSPDKTPEFSSIFLAGVNQTTPVGATDSASIQGGTVSTGALATAYGDLVILAGTHQKDTSSYYNTNNGFTEAYGHNADGMAIIAGHKFATGSPETPSISNSITDRNQVIVGAVITSAPVTLEFDPPTPDPATFAVAPAAISGPVLLHCNRRWKRQRMADKHFVYRHRFGWFNAIHLYGADA